MKKFIVILTVYLAMAAAFAKPLPPETRKSIESVLPELEQVIERNTQALDNNRLQAEMLEFALGLLDEKHELKRPSLKLLKAVNKYNEWLAEYISVLQKRREIFANMLETGEYDMSIKTVNYGYTVEERAGTVRNNFAKAQAEYNAAVRAYNLKRGM